MTAVAQGAARACLLRGLRRIVVEYNEIPIGHVETRKVIHCVFRVKNVVINYKGSSPGVLCTPSAQNTSDLLPRQWSR